MVLGLRDGGCHVGLMLPQVQALGDCKCAVAIKMDRTAYSDHDKNWKHVQGKECVLLIVQSFNILSDDRFKAFSKVIPPHSAI
jgi:hypothetical protein